MMVSAAESITEFGVGKTNVVVVGRWVLIVG